MDPSSNPKNLVGYAGGRANDLAISAMLTTTVLIPFPLPSTYAKHVNIVCNSFANKFKYLCNKHRHFVSVEFILDVSGDINYGSHFVSVND